MYMREWLAEWVGFTGLTHAVSLSGLSLCVCVGVHMGLSENHYLVIPTLISDHKDSEKPYIHTEYLPCLI